MVDTTRRCGMNTQLSKWGHSLAVRIPKSVTEKARLKEGDIVDVSVTDDGAVLVRPTGRKYTLDELVARITPKNSHDEFDWGPPVGREAW
jgi:antitoxin MazE